MIVGIVPSNTRTFEVYGTTESKNPVEGKLYYDEKTKRLYYYSSSMTRSNPENGYFPIWNGSKYFVTNFSNEKYYDKDGIPFDMKSISNSINDKVAEDIRYKQRRSESPNVLNPVINDGDNMFTQCVKGVIQQRQYTMVDLIEMGSPKVRKEVIEGYYSSLMKIAFMRMEKWHTWVNSILHLSYVLCIYKEDQCLITYYYPRNQFELDDSILITPEINCILNSKQDPYKKMIQILLEDEIITKEYLKQYSSDDYTINNMITAVGNKKPLSAQLFSRFLRMSELSYFVRLYDENGLVFEYAE